MIQFPLSPSKTPDANLSTGTGGDGTFGQGLALEQLPGDGGAGEGAWLFNGGLGVGRFWQDQGKSDRGLQSAYR